MGKRFINIARASCATALAAACCWGLASCGSSASGEQDVDPVVVVSDTSGGVAATVNGVEIGENAVTAYVANFRSSQGLESDDDWGAWLIEYGYTVDSLRAETVNYYVSQELIRQAADAHDVVVDESQVDAAMQEMRGKFGTEEEWDEAIASTGTTEEGYRVLLELTQLQERLTEAVAGDAHATDEEVLSYLQSHGSSFNGAKRSSYILFDASDEAAAQEVRDNVAAGELDFAQAAKEYSIDEPTASIGGEAGWSGLNTYMEAYSSALKELEKGQVSDLVKTDGGIFIITCTDVLEVPEEVTALTDVDENFVASVRSLVDESAKQQAYSEWMKNYEDEADIVVNAMPDGLSYVIDLAPYEEAAAQAAAEEAGESQSQ